MTNILHTFWDLEDNKLVAMTLLELASLFRNRELAIPMNVKFSVEIEKLQINYRCILLKKLR